VAEQDEIARSLEAEAFQSRGPSDDRLYKTSSVLDDSYVAALGFDPYMASDAELAAMPVWARKALLAQRSRRAAYWAAKDAQYAKAYAGKRRHVDRLNRDAALRKVADLEQWFAACACGWCGLRVADPEVARREYDAHVCAISGDEHVERAVEHVNDAESYGAKREHADMQVVAKAWDAMVDCAATQMAKVGDETEQRMALLELK